MFVVCSGDLFHGHEGEVQAPSLAPQMAQATLVAFGLE